MNKGPGAPIPNPSSWTRLQPYLQTAIAGGVVVSGLLYVTQIVLPNGWRPGEVMGGAAGDFERIETQQKMAAKVEIERAIANAVAQANAKAQLDLLAAQTTLEERRQGLAGLSASAAIADAGCLVGRGIAANSRPTLGADYRQGYTGGDWFSFGTAIARTLCGLSDPLRDQVTRSQIDTMRDVAASRGLSMTNGAQPTPLK